MGDLRILMKAVPLLFTFVLLSNGVHIDETVSKPVMTFYKGGFVNLGWEYESHKGHEAKDFLCGYRNKDGEIFPLAIDTTGDEFVVAYAGGLSNTPNDDRMLLELTKETYAENINNSTRRRGFTLTKLEKLHEGEYFCNVLYTSPKRRLAYGGYITLKFIKRKLKKPSQIGLIAGVIGGACAIFGIGSVLVAMYHKTKRTESVINYSLASTKNSDDYDVNQTSSDEDDDIEFQR